MGRVSTCQKNCNTIDLRRAQVNKYRSLPELSKGRQWTSINSIEDNWKSSYLSVVALQFARAKFKFTWKRIQNCGDEF